MARQQTCSQPPSPLSRTLSRIAKTRIGSSTRRAVTRRRSRVLASPGSGAASQDMVAPAEQQENGDNVDGEDAVSAAGDSDSRTGTHTQADTGSDKDALPESACPITDMNQNPFRIMDLPTEIRLEIYRACLTRPYNILLSKQEPIHLPRTRIVKIQRSAEDTVSENDTTASEVEASQPSQQPASTASFPPLEQGLASAIGDVSQLPSTSHPPLISRANVFPPSTNASDIGAGDTNDTVDLWRPPFIRIQGSSRQFLNADLGPQRPQSQDPLLSNVLLASKEVYKEARAILYNENRFTLDINTAITTLACLHQRSRRQIKHIELEIPSYNEILDKFQETVRLSLRYCSGLKKIVIKMPFSLPGADSGGTTGNTTVYANGFDILRWLPQQCDVVMEGNVCNEIGEIVNKHLHLARTLDKLSYARRQLISSDASHPVMGPQALDGCLHP